MALWEKLRVSRAHRDQAAASARISDLRLAASFVKSIETEDSSVNLEIRRVAQQIEHIADSLGSRAENADDLPHP